MKKLGVFLSAILLAFTFLKSKVLADLAPDPEPVEGTGPVILYAIGVGFVLMISFIIIKSLGKRNSKK
jgi:hypothetical protein